MPEKVVIIGSGPAAWTAAIYAARAQLDPLVIQGNPFDNANKANGTMPLGQLALTTEVENFPSWPAGDTRQYLKTALKPDDVDFPYWVARDKPQPTHGINGPELVALMRQQAVNFGTRVESKDVVKVDLAGRRPTPPSHDVAGTAAPADGHGVRPLTLTTHDGQTVETLALVVATGARANYLGLPSEDMYKNKGVSACAVCDGALPRFKNKPIVVVGGGDSAVEEATYLTKYSSHVFMFLRRDVLRASKIMQERARANPKITAVRFAEVAEVMGDDKGGVSGVRAKGKVQVVQPDGQPVSFAEYAKAREFGFDPPDTIHCAGLFLAIGHTPNTAFLDGQLKLNPKGYVEWAEKARTYTSIDGVFAAGDVADDYYRQAISAAGTGCMAALDAERWLGHHGLI